VAEFVSAVDIFLFSTVLFIFALGIYELFINKIDVVNRNKEERPNWLVVKSIDDLKTSLGKVILMILIVSFFEHSLSMKYDSILFRRQLLRLKDLVEYLNEEYNLGLKVDFRLLG